MRTLYDFACLLCFQVWSDGPLVWIERLHMNVHFITALLRGDHGTLALLHIDRCLCVWKQLITGNSPHG
jgi:hypothetical protein